MLDGAAAVAALVLLAGRLPAHAEPGGNFWPPDAQTDSVIDQHRELCLCLPLKTKTMIRNEPRCAPRTGNPAEPRRCRRGFLRRFLRGFGRCT